MIGEADTDSDLKSPVSLAHELALKLNQTVEFTVVSIRRWQRRPLIAYAMTEVLVSRLVEREWAAPHEKLRCAV